jgi:hypothetical protein
MDSLMQELSGHPVTATSIFLLTGYAIVLSVVAGALSGMALAGKDLGNNFAALMGAMFGPIAAIPGVLVGLLVIAFL